MLHEEEWWVSNEPTRTSNYEITGAVGTTDAEDWGARNYSEKDGQTNGTLEDESNDLGLLCPAALWKGRKASGWKGKRSEGRYTTAESKVCFSGPQSITATLCAGMAMGWSSDGRSAERQSSAGHTGGLAWRTTVLPRMSIRGGLRKF